MKKALLSVALVVLVFGTPLDASDHEAGIQPALVIHGGAGTMKRSQMSEEREAEVRAKLAEALEVGYRVLIDGGSALDAVEQTIQVLEDSPIFNAGKGAVFTAAGRNELDASIMDGTGMRAGAVAGVTTIKNPISAARAVMEQTKHVLLTGSGAETFAESVGLEIVPNKYFFTERRWESLQKKQKQDKEREFGLTELPISDDTYLGTVGAVALDREGRLAAGTSTGGLTNKKHGRVGDSPIIGAGTYANGDCGVSATGHGEFFIRHAVAFDICARMRYQNQSVREAAASVVNGTLMEVGGAGGVIAMDGDGNHALVFNTRGMYRGWIDSVGKARTAIYGAGE